MKKGSILIIDDEVKLRSLFARLISAEGFDVLEASDCKTALKKLEQNDIDVVLSDVKLPDMSGLEFITKIKTHYPLTEVILLTAYGNIPDGVKAIKEGAFDYITKGDDNDRVIPLLYRALDKSLLQKRVRDLEKQVNQRFTFDKVIGKSKPILEAIEWAKKVAPNDTSVLLTGETGTGKEVFAEAIHEASTRSHKSMVALNCSSFSKELLEGELLGYKQGAFTGATKDKKGLLEEANGGTLFLDEIGEMPLELQAKLLRVLETSEFIKLGDTKTTKVNFRLIAATNKDLNLESEEKRFRSDLYFRLNVFQVRLPSLRERTKDIEPLAQFFVKRFSAKTNKKQLNISKEFLERLENYHWVGNIRELRNIIERCVILCDSDTLTPDLLPIEIQQASAELKNGAASSFSLASIEKLHIQKVYNYTKGNKAETARLLEIGIATLYRKLEEFGIS
ncbi:sigma-54-dependent Fis family transcriptional regulator [Sphingobacteriaceae bacterium]|nr:sigma-54-dependent Fis family transcriptional regulator [Sphingobacteriaceae bacterium]